MSCDTRTSCWSLEVNLTSSSSAPATRLSSTCSTCACCQRSTVPSEVTIPSCVWLWSMIAAAEALYYQADSVCYTLKPVVHSQPRFSHGLND